MAYATILGCAGLTLSADERALFRAADPWGFILFARNVDTPDQLRRLTDALRETVGREAAILVDQEGGRVQRLRPPYWRDWPAPLDQAETARDPARSFRLRARLMADELRAVGIDANCAPCCDLATPETHPFLRNRCMGSDVTSVVANARATAEGFLAGGVLPIVKHMPGHGRAVSDSHKETPEVATPAAELRATDFAVFRALADLPLGMTSHVRYTAFDDAPATQSPRMIGLIRDEIGFDGLLMSDDIDMQALSGTPAERAALSINAGCDLVLHCNGDIPAMEASTSAAGPLSAVAEARSARALALRHAPDAVDIAALSAELDALLTGGKVHG